MRVRTARSVEALQCAYRGVSRGKECDMVATFELVFLIAFVLLGAWWFSRTNLYRARSSRFGGRQGVDPKNRSDPPNHGYGGEGW